MEITQNGMYVLDANFLSSLRLSDIDPRTIRIFSTGGAMMLPMIGNRGNAFEEIPLHVVSGDDGNFTNQTRIYFYAETRDGIGKNIPLRSSSFGHHRFQNPYSGTGIYWLTWGTKDAFGTDPLRMSFLDTTNPVVTRNTGRVFTHHEMSRTRLDVVGFEWYSHVFTSSHAEYSVVLQLEDLDTTESQTITYIATAARATASNNPHRFNIRIGSNPAFHTHSWTNTSLFRRTDTGRFFLNGTNNVVFTSTGPTIERYLKSFNITWHRNLIKRSSTLHFQVRSIDTGRVIRYEIDNRPLNHDLMAFQVNRFNEVFRLRVSDNSFLARGDENTLFFVSSHNDFMYPASIINVHGSGIELSTKPHDIMIIYPAEFEAGANRLVDIYRDYHGFVACAVTLDNVYNNFSGGHPDPVAIRNFLGFLQGNSEGVSKAHPLGAVFLGSGTNDQRNFENTQTVRNRNRFPVNQINSTPSGGYDTTLTSDDYYAMFNVRSHPEIIVGRIPAGNVNQLSVYLRKLEDYMRNTHPGWWQYRFQFIADDHLYGISENDVVHTRDTEMIARTIRNNIFVDKIHGMEYPLDPFRRRPEAKRQLVNRINEGRLFWMYIGHGRARNNGDERYFNADDDIPLLRNIGRYPIYIAASCNVGQYDLSQPCLAEELVILPNAGSIISIAGTRASTSTNNRNLFTRFLNHAVNERQRPGEALLNAKWTAPLNQNAHNEHRTYNILGDPFLKIAFPTITNNLTFENVFGVAQRGQLVRLSGDFERLGIRNPVDNLVYDNGRAYRFTPAVGSDTVDISHENLPIFSGETTLMGSEYNLNFIIPLDASHGNNARILTMGIDSNNRVYINKTNNFMISEEQAHIENWSYPEIEIFLDCAESFVEGATVSPVPTLIARISDENGVHTIGSPGRNMTIKMDSSNEVITATPGFRYDRDSYTQGTLTWRLRDLTPGRHTVFVTTYNNINLPTVADTWFITSPSVSLKITNPLVYPNPMRNDGGHFTFDLSHSANITIQIYTITGRRIQTITQNNASPGYNQIYWNGLDYNRHRPANNTYFYTIRASAVDGRGTAEIKERLVMLR
jgi:hypothetical protein